MCVKILCMKRLTTEFIAISGYRIGVFLPYVVPLWLCFCMYVCITYPSFMHTFGKVCNEYGCCIHTLRIRYLYRIHTVLKGM